MAKVALALARALGEDRRMALDLLEGSHMGSVVRSKRGLVEGGEHAAEVTLSLAEKDLRLLADRPCPRSPSP